MQVADLIDDDVLALQVRASASDADLARTITGCSQSELFDPTPFLSRGEFLLTMGMGLHVRDQRTWDAYVERHVRAGVSGLAFGIGPIHATVPDGLVVACERQGVPLIELPPEFPLPKLSRHIWQELASERYAIARRGWELADECTHLATEGAELPVILGRVAAEIGGNVSLVDSADFVLAVAGEHRFAPRTESRTTLRLPGGEHARFRLVVETGGETMLLQPLLGPTCAVIAMQLTYTLTARSPLHSHTAARFFEALLDVKGAPPETLRALATTAGFRADGPWDALVLRRPEEVTSAALRLATWRLRVLLERHYERVRFFDEAYQATLLMQGPRGSFALEEVAVRSVAPVDGLSTSFATELRFDELPLAVQAARRAPVVPGVTRMRTVDLLSMVDALPTSGLVSLARRMLAALDDADGQLLETLEAYLELSGATNAVCARLFIHRNTLAYRIQRIERLLGMDLRDGRTRATLMLAIDLLRGAGRSAQSDAKIGANHP